jgi:hypothetical protein
MSKTDRIWSLLQAGKSVRETARLVGCLEPYVRAVRQRKTSTDNAYTRYNARFRKIAAKYGDRDAARQAYLQAYQRCRDMGMASRKASSIAGGSYSSTLRKTALANIPPAT